MCAYGIGQVPVGYQIGYSGRAEIAACTWTSGLEFTYPAPFHDRDGNTGEVFFIIFGAQMFTTVIRKRYISFLLLLCFVVIPLHSMIPHHHHDGVYIPVGTTHCPGNHSENHSENHPGNHPGNHSDSHSGNHPDRQADQPQKHQHQPQKHQHQPHPVHCHAFNEISFYKNVLPGLSQPSELPVLYANHPSPEQTAPGLRFVKSIINPRIFPIQSRYCGDVVSLRGPPSAA